MGQNASHPAFRCQFLSLNKENNITVRICAAIIKENPQRGTSIPTAGAQASQLRFSLLPSCYTIPSPKREVFLSQVPFRLSSQQKPPKQYNCPLGTPLSEKQPSFPGLDPFISTTFLVFSAVKGSVTKYIILFRPKHYYDFKAENYKFPFSVYFSNVFCYNHSGCL